MLLYLAVGLTFGSAALIAVSVLQPRANPLAQRLMPAGSVSAAEDPDMDRPLLERVGGPLFEGTVGLVWRFAPPKVLKQLDLQLTLAGRPGGVSAPTFLALILLAGAIVPTIYLLMGAGLGTLNPNQWLAAAVLIALCLQAPRFWLSMRIKKRQKQVQKRLPDALDLIVVCVEAGLGLDAALAKVAEETGGPLAQELRRALLESSMGKLRRVALRDMASRLQVPDLTSFVAALCQADQMGTSLATVLRAQAAQMRVKRRQRAEQEAMRAPLKMLFPLVFFIFPAVFVVILGPAIINLMGTFSGANGP